jgi:hypothetical protein
VDGEEPAHEVRAGDRHDGEDQGDPLRRPEITGAPKSGRIT